MSTETAIVAGATGNLGGAITRKLADRGLNVIALARNEEKLAELAAASHRITPVIADMAENSVIETIRTAVDGRPIRMSVQAVGLPIRPKDAAFDPDSLGRAVNIKAGGLMRMMDALDGSLHEGSRVVVLGGYHGFEPDPTAIGPGVVNAGLANLVRILSYGLGEKGISIHMLSPGPVDTTRIRKLADDASRMRGIPAEEILEEWRNESTLAQLITTDQVAWAVALLLDPEAVALHGSVIHMDGGRRKGIV